MKSHFLQFSDVHGETDMGQMGREILQNVKSLHLTPCFVKYVYLDYDVFWSLEATHLLRRPSFWRLLESKEGSMLDNTQVQCQAL